MQNTVLTDSQIRSRLRTSPPLVEGILDEAIQIQPCGVDLTVRTVSRFESSGVIEYNNAGRVLSSRDILSWADERVELPPGGYHVVYNEQVNLPCNIMALAYPRSSLLRCGATIYTAVWDPGYSGRAEALLVVHNSHGFVLGRNARVAQLVFTLLGTGVQSGYEGRFNNENL